MRRIDPAGWLLRLAVWLLPGERRDWGHAMHAELLALSSPRDRWTFAAGCLRAVLIQPCTVRRVGYPLLATGILVAALAWASGVVLVGTTVLVGLSWWGRHAGPFGPVGTGPAARAVRAAGHLVVGGLGLAFALALQGDSQDPPSEVALVVAVLLAVYLAGVLALTAHGSAATGRVLAATAGGSLAGTLLWSALVIGAPPIPADIGMALLFTAVGAALAGWTATGPGGDSGHRLLAALGAGTLSPLLIFVDVLVLSSWGPARLIPHLVPAALTPADRLANSRIELVDPYVALPALAGLLAVALTVGSLATRGTRDDGRDPEPIVLPR